MSQGNVPPLRVHWARTALAAWPASHWVAVAVMLAGFLMVVWSPLVGEPLYSGAVTPLVELLGAPEEREFLHPQDPGNGTELLALLGVCNLAVGFCMFCVLLAIDLLGRAGAPARTSGMTQRSRLALGTAAAGAAALVAGEFPKVLLSTLFVDHEHEITGVVGALDIVSQAGGLMMLCTAITFYLGGSRRHGVLLRWTEVVGWGKVRRGWVNMLALALTAGGLIATMLWFIMPFDDVAGVFAIVGLTVLVLGLVPHLLAIGRP